MSLDFIDHRPTEGTGAVQLRWVPVPHLAFEFTEAGSSDAVGYTGGPLLLPGFDQPLVSHFHEVRSAGHGEPSQFQGTVRGPVRSHTPREADYVVFHLANVDRFFNAIRRGRDYEPELPGGRLLLLDDEWQVILDQADPTRELYDGLEESSGFAITHVGRLERADGRPLSVEQIGQAMAALRIFLSFARGYWIAPMLPVAFNGTSELWRSWSIPDTREWHRAQSWLPWDHAWTLLRLFPKFRQLLFDPTWSEPLQRAVYWYVGANDSRATAETSIILAYVALELLAWVLVVEDQKLVEPTKFDGKKGEQRLRHLLKACSVPAKIPAQLENLGRLGESIQAADGPAVLAAARNALAHASPRPQRIAVLQSPGPVMTEAWQLAMWYLDLVLLRVLGHESHYANRLSGGKTEVVPWGSAPSPDEVDV